MARDPLSSLGCLAEKMVGFVALATWEPEVVGLPLPWRETEPWPDNGDSQMTGGKLDR